MLLFYLHGHTASNFSFRGMEKTKKHTHNFNSREQKPFTAWLACLTAGEFIRRTFLKYLLINAKWKLTSTIIRSAEVFSWLSHHIKFVNSLVWENQRKWTQCHTHWDHKLINEEQACFTVEKLFKSDSLRQVLVMLQLNIYCIANIQIVLKRLIFRISLSTRDIWNSGSVTPRSYSKL